MQFMNFVECISSYSLDIYNSKNVDKLVLRAFSDYVIQIYAADGAH